jgi:hypothetical protein
MTDKEARIYEQNCQEFRSLNGFFWQVPLIMMTLNGGLWYSVASLDLSVTAQRGVLAFAVVANLVMAVALGRLRNVMASLLVEIHAFQGTAAPGRARLIQYLFQSLMLFAAIGAFLAALNPQQQFIRKPEPTPAKAQPGLPPTNNSAKHEGAS